MKGLIIGVLVYITTWGIYLCHQSDYYKFVFATLTKIILLTVIIIFSLVALKMKYESKKGIKKNEKHD